MRMILKSAVAIVGSLALAAPAIAQQGGGQGAPPPGAQGAPRPGAGPGGGGGPGGAGGGRARPAPPPPNTGIALSASLSGRGTGYIGVVIDPPKGQICYILNVANVDTPTMAHIHQGGPGQDGPPVVPLLTPTNGSSGECKPIAADVAQRILANPGGYYVNVHTAKYPDGAARGQLKK